MAGLAVPAYAVLDGIVLERVETWRVSRRRISTVREAKRGRVEQVPLPEPGYPEVRHATDFEIAWTAIPAGEMRDRVRMLLATSGLHRLTLWRSEHRAWLGDGGRRTFFLPTLWRLAIDGQVPSHGQVADFEPQFRIGIEGATMPFALQDASTFDAGDPPPGEVWARAGDNIIKLGTAPPAGERLYGAIAPAYPVIVAPARDDKTLTEVTREPMVIRLLEV